MRQRSRRLEPERATRTRAEVAFANAVIKVLPAEACRELEPIAEEFNDKTRETLRQRFIPRLERAGFTDLFNRAGVTKQRDIEAWLRDAAPPEIRQVVAEFNRAAAERQRQYEDRIGDWLRKRHLYCPIMETWVGHWINSFLRTGRPPGWKGREHRWVSFPVVSQEWDQVLAGFDALKPLGAPRVGDAELDDDAFLAPLSLNPLGESPDQALERARKHYAARAAAAESRGYVPVLARHRLDDHARWLARHQVLGESVEEILAHEPSVSDRRTIEKALENLCRDLKLRKRPAKRGRRPGAKNSARSRRVSRRRTAK